MAYCVLADLVRFVPERRLVQLAADTAAQAATGIADDTVVANINAMIEAGDSEIDGILSSRMTVPVTPVSARLKLCSAHLAIWWLFSRKKEISIFGEKDYERQIAWLEKVQASELSLGSETVPEHETVHTTADGYEIDGSDRAMVFGGGGIDDFGRG